MRSKPLVFTRATLDAIIEPARLRAARLAERFAADLQAVATELYNDLTTAALAGDPRTRGLALETMRPTAAPKDDVAKTPAVAIGRPSTRAASRGQATRSSGGRKAEPARVERLLRLIQHNPGLTLEQINRALGTTRKQWRAHLARLIASRRIHTEGVTRAKRYFSGGTSITDVLPAGLIAIRDLDHRAQRDRNLDDG